MPTGTLSEKQAIFKQLFKDQFSQELEFIDDVANGRAQDREGIKKKLFNLIKTVVGPFDEIGITDIVGDTLEIIFSELKERLSNDSKILKGLMWVRRERPAQLENVIEEIAHRLALQLATVVNRVTKESLPTMVHGSVMRIIDHCAEKNMRDTDLYLPNVFLDGIIHGNSGAFNETLRNTSLELEDEYGPEKSGSRLKQRLKEDSHLHAFTVEGIGRSGFAVANPDGTTSYFAHEFVEHRNAADHAKETLSAIKKRFDDHGKLRAIQGLDKAFSVSSHNYTKLDDKGQVKYGFIQILAKHDGRLDKLFVYDAAAGLKDEDKQLHEELVAEGRLVRVDDQVLKDYLDANKTTPQSLNAYVKGIAFVAQKTNVQSLDLDRADFSGSILSRMNFTGKKLSNINFSNCMMVEVNLENAQVKNCDFSNSNLGGAKLDNAKFSSCDFTMTNCSATSCANTSFVSLKYLGSRWDSAKMNNVKMDDALRTEFESHRTKMKKWRLAQQEKTEAQRSKIVGLEEKITALEKTQDSTGKSVRAREKELDDLRFEIAESVDSYYDESAQLLSIIQNHDMSFTAFADALENRMAIVEHKLKDVESRIIRTELIHGALIENYERMSAAQSTQSRPPSPQKINIQDWQLPLHNDRFIRNPDFFDKMTAAFNNTSGPTVVMQLTGKPQCGKTETAQELCHHLKNKSKQTIVLWVNAGDGQSMRDAYFALAKNHIDPTGKSTDAVINEFNNQVSKAKNWVLVFDNVENPKELKTLIPTQGGNVIITTQNPSHDYKKIPIADLNKTEARDFIKAHLNHAEISEDQYNQIFARLGGWVGPLKDACNQLNQFSSLAIGLESLGNMVTSSQASSTGSMSKVMEQFDTQLAKLDDNTKMFLRRMKFFDSEQLPINLLADIKITSIDILKDHIPKLQNILEVSTTKEGKDLIRINPLYLSAIQTNASLQQGGSIADYLSAVQRTLSFYSNDLQPNKPEFMTNTPMWKTMGVLTKHYQALSTEINAFINENPDSINAHYDLLLMFGYQARHCFAKKDFKSALTHTERALDTIKKFSDDQLLLLFSNPDKPWVSDKYNALKDDLRSVMSLPEHSRTAMDLLTVTIEIDKRKQRLANAQARQQEVDLKASQAASLAAKISQPFQKNPETQSTKTLTMDEKKFVMKQYKQRLENAINIEELEAIYNAIQKEDTVMNKNASFLGMPIPKFVQALPVAYKHQLEQFYHKRHKELEIAEANPSPKKGS